MKNKLKNFLDNNKYLVPILDKIISADAVPFLVGGTVRDMVLNLNIKDIDIETHGIDLDALENILSEFGNVREVGKQFGVLMIDGLDIDWSIPRRDSFGRRPTVELDPKMDIKDAARRRDLTLNAIAINLKTGELCDPFNGLKDIKAKVLRAVDEKLFYDDPLRFYRVVQFISRFEVEPDYQLVEICKKIKLDGVAKERIFQEFKKLLLKSYRPSLGIRFLKKIGRLREVFPDLYNLIGVKQSETHHPEGDVFEHTMQALDASGRLDLYRDDKEKLLIMLAVLAHDIGKATTTDENFRAIGHDRVGAKMVKSFLNFVDNVLLLNGVKKLVRHHLMPFNLLDQGSSLSAYRRLSVRLAPEVVLRQLGLVALCDKQGRNKDNNEPLEDHYNLFDMYMEKVRAANVLEGAPKKILQGRDLMDAISPGVEMGKLLDIAYQIQIDEGVEDKEELKRRVLKDKKHK